MEERKYGHRDDGAAIGDIDSGAGRNHNSVVWAGDCRPDCGVAADSGVDPPPIPALDPRFQALSAPESDVLIGIPHNGVICGKGDDTLTGGADILPGYDARGNDVANGGRNRDACTTDRRDERINC